MFGFGKLSEVISGFFKSLFFKLNMSNNGIHEHVITTLILDLCPANGRRRYFVTTSLIGWVQT